MFTNMFISYYTIALFPTSLGGALAFSSASASVVSPLTLTPPALLVALVAGQKVCADALYFALLLAPRFTQLTFTPLTLTPFIFRELTLISLPFTPLTLAPLIFMRSRSSVFHPGLLAFRLPTYPRFPLDPHLWSSPVLSLISLCLSRASKHFKCLRPGLVFQSSASEPAKSPACNHMKPSFD